MHAPIHPVQNEHAKVGKRVGREGTPGLVLSAYGGEKGVEGVVMMYGACEIVKSEYVFSS